MENCLSVWRGYSPIEIAKSEEELATLETLLLLFFEQELNWGNEEWQRSTYFAPKIRTPNRVRPRDMLMGFVVQAFSLGIDNIAYWQRIRPTTTTFKSPDGSNYGFEDYPIQYKRFFDELRDDGEALAVMVEPWRSKFRSLSEDFYNNPEY